MKINRIIQTQKAIYENYAQINESYESFNEIFNLTNSNHLNMIAKLNFTSGKKVLDVGCASGNLIKILAKKYGIHGYGIDITPTAIQKAKRRKLKNCFFSVARAEKLMFTNEFFDFVISFGCLEHVSDYNKAISEISRVLKKGGKALIWMPNKDNKYSFHWLDGQINPRRQARDMKNAGHDYNTIPDSKTICATIQKHGLKIIYCQVYDSLLQSIYDYKILPLNSKILRILIKCIYGKNHKDINEIKEITSVKTKRNRLYSFYKLILPIIRIFCLPDKILSKLKIGASIYVIMEKK